MKKGRVNATYEEDYIKETRTFPTSKTVLLIVILLIQIGIIFAAFSYNPQPQDIIKQYNVTVNAQDDGTLDILYHFVWKAMDPSEELTWVELGMANNNYTVYPESVSDTISQYTPRYYEDETYLVLYLDRAYTGGEVLEFSFKINQKDMLCKDNGGYFYEFIPGWFNATPVENYSFKWADNGKILSAHNAEVLEEYYLWNASLDCGDYTIMNVRYDSEAFTGCHTVSYLPFDDSGAYNSLIDEKIAMIVLAVIVAAFLIIIQVWTVDSVVSYHRGRGFLSGHGFYVHTYGRSNPHFIRARNRYNSTHSGRSSGRFSGGCACACACACAGGGRAGCSQKDTYATSRKKPFK